MATIIIPNQWIRIPFQNLNWKLTIVTNIILVQGSKNNKVNVEIAK